MKPKIITNKEQARPDDPVGRGIMNFEIWRISFIKEYCHAEERSVLYNNLSKPL